MATMRTIGSIAAALALSGGLSLTNAQQTYTPTPYGSSPPRYEEPPPLKPTSPYEPASEGPIQFYTQPAEPAQPPTPSASPSPRPYAAPTPVSAEDSYTPDAEDTGPGWLPPGDRIQVQDYRGIRYASGGVGESERAELNALSGQFNLRLLFAMQGSGDYLADTKVIIADKRGETVLSATSNGPWFYAQLPPGTYTVEASTPDQTQRQPVTIGTRQSRLNFYWR
ncbi:carboxypeptidase regulatory-like domain-containing protein [Candidatus Competibacter phosphatis]|uniref:Carboxypeptidase regulatory-like domain-containing protein n=1 Tax=Candidatus Competibacter phosphatis TaxID=221280 RepID=A0ABX1TNJ1_9GAMM|nr:carboxypeptidase-like regulatory domain-containing protein [Candidatus Competibacter phosphatis]NMQ20993.1 carboxypeptidase regulatory-like domain-containing protein [Candidatus Competibacter phosphatis]